jgi:hypothetical protein
MLKKLKYEKIAGSTNLLLARQIQANMNVTMKMEVVKLPDFYGEPGKDTITALEFMARIDECQVTNEWNDITTFSYFCLALRGQADKWLSSIVRHMQLTAAQKMWTRIRPVFKAEFAAFSYDKLIIDRLAKLTHRPNENPRMFFSRLEELVFVLKENYASYGVKPDRPPPIQPQGMYTEDALTKYTNDSVDAFANFLFTQMFKAAAPAKFIGYYPTRINQGSRWKRPARSSSRTTGWRWIRSSLPCMR